MANDLLHQASVLGSTLASTLALWRGTRLVKAAIPGARKPKATPPRRPRWIDVHVGDLDEARMATWVQQAGVTSASHPNP